MSQDTVYMQHALEQARQAECVGEVPVGAVIVFQDEIIAAAHNQMISLSDPSAHAEIVVLREAGRLLGNYRLNHCQLYVTLEPCCMCAGAMVHARIERLVYGAADPKTGAAGSVFNLLEGTLLNHRVSVEAAVLADECSMILKNFFKKRRQSASRL